MKKEFKSLSEFECDENCTGHYHREKIKEAVKRLKEKRVAVNGRKNTFVVYWEDIKEIFGEKLT